MYREYEVDFKDYYHDLSEKKEELKFSELELIFLYLLQSLDLLGLVLVLLTVSRPVSSMLPSCWNKFNKSDFKSFVSTNFTTRAYTQFVILLPVNVYLTYS